MLRGMFIILILLLGAFRSTGQDTVRVMYYNLLNFPDDSPERVLFLREILGYTKPDVLVVNELLTEEGANLIINEALNVWGEDKYASATFIDGPDTDNMLYYNAEKLGLVSQQQIPTGLRDISEYKLYYKSPGIGPDSDTIYFQFYSMHLKAGSGFFNQRKEEALILKYHLNSLNNVENIFAGGDFNFYSGNESGCLAIRESGDIELFDPIESIGDWSGNWDYAHIHTQSTRTSALADGAGGGLDDRFDLIFVSEDVSNNENGITYIPDSYKALGQDGDRFNESIRVPYNPIVPDSIADALYFMSDHLPVLMDVMLDYTAGLNASMPTPLMGYYSSQTKEFLFNEDITGHFQLFDLTGRSVYTADLESENRISLSHFFGTGIFFWSLEGHSGKILITD